MRYRELLNSLSDEEFAQVVAEDGIFNVACVSNLEGAENICKYKKIDCFKCILALLQSEVDADVLKRDSMQD